MTKEKSYLEELQPYSNNYVTFGDGAKARIKGICKLVYYGLPSLDNVLLVEGLTINLININQLCSQGLKVSFNKLECVVSSQDQGVVMKGSRSKDNCYLWISLNKEDPSTCIIITVDETKLCH